MKMEDEYIRVYAFEPEFIQRKDSLNTHVDQSQKQVFSSRRKLSSVEKFDSSSDEDVRLTFVEAEVRSFSSVNM